VITTIYYKQSLPGPSFLTQEANRQMKQAGTSPLNRILTNLGHKTPQKKQVNASQKPHKIHLSGSIASTQVVDRAETKRPQSAFSPKATAAATAGGIHDSEQYTHIVFCKMLSDLSD
jgi:hypothetical protein